MVIELPDHEIGFLKLSSAEARLDFSIGLYTGRRPSMGKAAKVAGLSYSEFLQELGRRGIAVNYGPDDLAQDLAVLESKRSK